MPPLKFQNSDAEAAVAQAARDVLQKSEFDNLRQSVNELHGIAQTLVDSVKEIQVAVVGNPTMQQPGLVQRLDSVEQQVLANKEKTEEHARKFLVWGTWITAITSALGLVLHNIKDWLTSLK